MKRSQSLALLITAPLLLAAVVWQSGRFAALAAEARSLELEQESWVEENEKLVGGIAVLESRERAARLAEELGLEKAAPERRLFVSTRSAERPAAAAPRAASERSDG